MECTLDLTFIIPTYNRESVLKEVLTQLYGQQYACSYEVIVVDNNSADGSVAMVQECFPQVRLFAKRENLGAASRNFAITQARGRVLMMLDDDSYPVAGSINTAMQILDSDHAEKIGCIAFNIRRADGSYETSGIYMNFTGCGAMFRRAVFEKVGGYPEDYLFYVEEYDLSSRILAHGLRIVNFKEIEALHLKTGVNRDFNINLRQLVKNNLCLWSKYLPRRLADRQIAAELWRYEKIGRKENALAGFEEGRRLGLEQVDRYRRDRSHEVSLPVAEVLLDLGNIRRRIGLLSKLLHHRRVLVFNLGKLIAFVLDELKQQRCEIIGIIDDNVFMQQDTFEGVAVYPRQRLEQRDYNCILIGSSSLALNDCFEAELKELALEMPIQRLCDYDSLEDYL